ncbi:hypothetical protein N9740_10540, partial [Pseudomonadales bacterium]|nr:hypothetical protein [Pseudomonadales bacterium]
MIKAKVNVLTAVVNSIESLTWRQTLKLLTMLISLAVGAAPVLATNLDVPVGLHKLTAASSPALELVGRWDGGPVYSSTVSGEYVYFGMGGGIRVLHIEQNANPNAAAWREVASVTTSGVVKDLTVSGHHLYVADDGGAMRIIDISKPTQPLEVAHIDLQPNVRAVAVEGNYAYLTAGWLGLVIIDISDPQKPRQVRKFKTQNYAVDVHVAGSLAFVANITRG